MFCFSLYESKVTKYVYIIIDTIIGTLNFVVIGYEVVNHCLPLSSIFIFALVGLRLMFE